MIRTEDFSNNPIDSILDRNPRLKEIFDLLVSYQIATAKTATLDPKKDAAQWQEAFKEAFAICGSLIETTQKDGDSPFDAGAGFACNYRSLQDFCNSEFGLVEDEFKVLASSMSLEVVIVAKQAKDLPLSHSALLSRLKENGFDFEGFEENLNSPAVKKYFDDQATWVDFRTSRKGVFPTTPKVAACDLIIKQQAASGITYAFSELATLFSGEIPAAISDLSGKFYLEPGTPNKIYLFGSEQMLVLDDSGKRLKNICPQAQPTDFLPANPIGSVILSRYQEISAISLSLTASTMPAAPVVTREANPTEATALISQHANLGRTLTAPQLEAAVGSKASNKFGKFCERNAGQAIITAQGNLIIISSKQVLVIPQSEVSTAIREEVSAKLKINPSLTNEGSTVSNIEEAFRKFSDPELAMEVRGALPVAHLIRDLQFTKTKLSPKHFATSEVGISAAELGVKFREKQSMGVVRNEFKGLMDRYPQAACVPYGTIESGLDCGIQFSKEVSGRTALCPAMTVIRIKEEYLTVIFGTDSLILLPSQPDDFLLKNCRGLQLIENHDTQNIYKFLVAAVEGAIHAHEMEIPGNIQILLNEQGLVNLRPLISCRADMLYTLTTCDRETAAIHAIIESKRLHNCYYLHANGQQLIVFLDGSLAVFPEKNDEMQEAYAIVSLRNEMSPLDLTKDPIVESVLIKMFGFSRFEDWRIKSMDSRAEFVREKLPDYLKGIGVLPVANYPMLDIVPLLAELYRKFFVSMYETGHFRNAFVSLSKEDHLVVFADNSVAVYSGFSRATLGQDKYNAAFNHLGRNLGSACPSEDYNPFRETITALGLAVFENYKKAQAGPAIPQPPVLSLPTFLKPEPTQADLLSTLFGPK